MRAIHTRCMCVESVKQFRIGSVRSVAGSARCAARNARCLARDAARVVRKFRRAAHRCGACQHRSGRRCHAATAGPATPQPRRSIGTTGRCAAPV
jgi:hypothetical protein